MPPPAGAVKGGARIDTGSVSHLQFPHAAPSAANPGTDGSVSGRDPGWDDGSCRRALDETALKRTTWAAVLLVVGLATAARTLRPPLDYAVGHWLLDDRHGLVPRGLLGSVLSPLWAFKTGEEIAWGIDLLAVGVLVALLAALAALLSRVGPGPGPRAAALAAMTSGWVVFAGHTVGYLDQPVALLVLGAVAGIGTRWRHAAALLLVPAVLVHEIAAFFVPMVLALTVLAARDRRAGWVDAAWVVGPVAIATGALWLAVRRVDPGAPAALEAAIAASGAVNPHVAPRVLHALGQAMVGGVTVPLGAALGNLARPAVAVVVLPPTVLLWGWTVAALWRKDRRAAVYVPLASLAPLGIHLLGSDAARFTLHVVLLAAVGLAGITRVAAVPGSQIGAIAALGVIAWNVAMEVPLMEGAQDRGGVLWPRGTPTASTFGQCTDAFENAGFERGELSGWTGTGFAVRTAAVRRMRSPAGTVGRFYATSLARKGERGTGELRSPPFVLAGDALLVAIGGEGRARLEVGGEVLARATGDGGEDLSALAWRIPLRVRGALGVAIVTDDSPEGHVSVDGLCWAGGAGAH